MRPLAGVAVALLLASSAATQTPTFRSRTEMVLVPVKVTKSNKHVPGLPKERFRVLEDGIERPVASFEEVTTATGAPAEPASLPPDTYTNQPVTRGPGHLTVFLLDWLNTPPLFQDNARKDLIKYIENRKDDGPLMLTVFRLDGLHVIQNYSHDPQVIIRTLRLLKGENRVLRGEGPLPVQQMDTRNPMGAISNERLIAGETNIRQPSAEPQAAVVNFRINCELNVAFDLLERTLEAMTQLANALVAVPGRKTLIWAGGGVPDIFGNNPLAWMRRGRELDALLTQTWAALNVANVAVYPVQVVPQGGFNPAYRDVGLYPSPFQSHGRALGWTNSPIDEMPGSIGVVQNMMWFAKRTGGKTCTFRNDLGDCFRNAVSDSADYYLLSYYASPRRPGWHKIKVTVEGHGLAVRARQGYMQPKVDEDPQIAQRVQINTALASPLDFTTLPMTLHWRQPEQNGKTVMVKFDLLLNAQSLTIADADANHLKFDLVALAFEPGGQRVGKITQTIDLHPDGNGVEKMLREGIRYTNYFDLPAGRYTVRVLIRDALSGKVGSLTLPLRLS